MYYPGVNRERLDRIRNYQSKDWYPAVFMRPLTIAVMMVVADWRWLTPNRLTSLANVSKLAAAALILPDEWAYTVAGVVLLQVGLLFDHMDGTMARYRGTFTRFGSFYDKCSDAITWFPVVMAVGWVAYQREGEPLMLVLAATHAYALLTLGYMKWQAQAELDKADWLRVAAGDQSIIERKTAPPKGSPPPKRTRAQFLRFYGWSWLQIVRFEETDLYFWIGLFLLIGHLDILMWGLAGTQVLGVLIMLVQRGREVHRSDVTLR